MLRKYTEKMFEIWRVTFFLKSFFMGWTSDFPEITEISNAKHLIQGTHVDSIRRLLKNYVD